MKVVSELNVEQKAKLESCEQTIRDGQTAFLKTAVAFHTIFVEELFKPEYEFFTAYCEAVWELDKTMASRYRIAGEVILDLDGEAVLPTNEGQARALSGAPKAERLVIWKKVVESGNKITAASVAKLVAKLVEKLKKRTAESEPQTGVAQVTGKMYDISLKVEKQHAQLTKLFRGEAENNIYTRTVPVANVADFLTRFGKWFDKSAEKYGLIEFSLSVAK